MIHFITESVELAVPMTTNEERLAAHIIAAEVIARKVFGDDFVDTYSVGFDSSYYRTYSSAMVIVTPAGERTSFLMTTTYKTNTERGTAVFEYERLVGSRSMIAIIGYDTNNSSYLSALLNDELLIASDRLYAFNTGPRMVSQPLPTPTKLATCALTPYYLAGEFETEIYHTSLTGSGWYGIGGQLYYVRDSLAYKID